MAILAVTDGEEVTLPKEALEHLGIPRGGEIELKLLPNGAVELEVARPTVPIRDNRLRDRI
jgi:bifunctional DNA-binding transcriptional regulator/antitoxin component of YhaV-PrlF toxin-antitoxin module